MGSQLNETRPVAQPVEIAIGRDALVGATWEGGQAAVLLLHDPTEDCSLDSWGILPELLASAGFSVLAIDLPGFGGSPALACGGLADGAAAAFEWLRSQQMGPLLAVAAGRALETVRSADVDALVLVAPVDRSPSPEALGTVPKLLIVGSRDPQTLTQARSLAQKCRGWTLLSTFAVENKMEALILGRSGQQICTQVVAFLNDYRTRSSSERSEPSDSASSAI